MPTIVLEAIQEHLNQKDEFVKMQEVRIEKLRAILSSDNPQEMELTKKQILERLIRAGILDASGNFTEPYESLN